MKLDYTKLAEKYEMSPTTVQYLANAIALGNGQQAQFSHPELGGMGQWMPGMIMIGDGFNYALKARVDALCHELAQAYRAGNYQSPATQATLSSHKWWSANLENPTIVGGQNTLRYAYFPKDGRLIIKQGDQEVVYNTVPHTIAGVSQQQNNLITSLIFQTSTGQILTVESFKVVHQ